MTDIRELLVTAREQRWGILTDLAFAVVWVTMVNVIFQVLEGPTWAYYMFMLAGIAAYFGLLWSFKMAVAQEKDRP